MRILRKKKTEQVKPAAPEPEGEYIVPILEMECNTCGKPVTGYRRLEVSDGIVKFTFAPCGCVYWLK
jgi:hypothetical protein